MRQRKRHHVVHYIDAGPGFDPSGLDSITAACREPIRVNLARRVTQDPAKVTCERCPVSDEARRRWVETLEQ